MIIDTIVYTDDIAECDYISEAINKGINCINVMDARSAVYVATGICAQNNKPVIVCIKGTNSSRSAFAGMTEAYYRNLPIILVTFGCFLDYSKELTDTVYGHYVVKDAEEIEKLLGQKKPMHIEVDSGITEIHNEKCMNLNNLLEEILEIDDYLFISQWVGTDGSFICKTVKGGIPDCLEGSLANVLGASLSRIRKRYIGLVTEEEFKHDINTIGNINANDLILYIVVCTGENELILDYASSLGYKVFCSREKELNKEYLTKIIRNRSKSVLLVYRETLK